MSEAISILVIRELIQLGWKDEGTGRWRKGDLSVSSLGEALIWELKYWKAVQAITFTCPDCNYKISYNEFDEALRD